MALQSVWMRGVEVRGFIYIQAHRRMEVVEIQTLPWSMNTQQEPLTREQRDILHHTVHRAAGGFYCGGGKDMDVLVSRGLMRSAGRKSFVPDEYFAITVAGRVALRESQSATP